MPAPSAAAPSAAAPPAGARTRATLRQLEAFCAVSIAGSVSTAAARLSRTQSAVSAAIAELEAALDAVLFERAGRGLRPTDAARRLLPRALEVVERAAELASVAAGAPGRPERLRVGASRTIGPALMPELLARLAAERPLATVELSVANTAELLGRLRRLEIDVAFVEGDVHAPGLALTAWMHDDLCLIARAGHPLAMRRARAAPAYRAGLAAAAWVLREPGSGTLETFLRAIAPVIGAPRVAATVDDPLALARLVAGTDWLGCMSRRAAADALAAGTIVELPPPDASVARALGRRFWIVRLPDRYRSAAVDALLAIALAAAGPGTRGAPRTRRDR